MNIDQMHWQQVERYLTTDDRCVIPIGCTEQHAFLSLSTDSILAGKIAVDAVGEKPVPVFPVMPYGVTPSFLAYPGSVSLRASTFAAVVTDILESLVGYGFRRFLIVNGHGGNTPGKTAVMEFLGTHPDCRVIWHDWWIGPKTWAAVQAIDPVASHASWMENFPWTRLEGVAMPKEQKPPVDLNALRQLPPKEARGLLGDGNFAGFYQRSDEEMLKIWEVAVAETRQLLEAGWA